MTVTPDGGELADRLHDGPQQVLASVGVRLDLLLRDVPDTLRAEVVEIARQVGMARQELRDVSRALRGDRPADQT